MMESPTAWTRGIADCSCSVCGAAGDSSHFSIAEAAGDSSGAAGDSSGAAGDSSHVSITGEETVAHRVLKRRRSGNTM